MTNFPASLDSFENPSADTLMDAGGYEHDLQHANLNDAVAALQAKVGINASANQATLDWMVSQMAAMILGANFSFRFKNGNFQIYDAGYAQWVTIVSNNGALGTSAPGP
jgi:hypothetical protein